MTDPDQKAERVSAGMDRARALGLITEQVIETGVATNLGLLSDHLDTVERAHHTADVEPE